MKRLAMFVLALSACSGGSIDTVDPKPETTVVDKTQPSSKSAAYALVTRTFDNLRSANLTACKDALRVYGPGMRCTFLLDDPVGRPALAQLSPANIIAAVIVQSGISNIAARVRVSKVSELETAILVTTPELGSLLPRETLAGRLINRHDKIDVE